MEKCIHISTETLNVSINDLRVKLGSHEYASMETAVAILAEGSLKFHPEVNIELHWKRAIRYMDTWNTCPTASLLSKFSFTDVTVTTVGIDETYT